MEIHDDAVPAALVIGASGAIGGAVLQQLQVTGEFHRVIAVSRRPAPEEVGHGDWLVCDNSEQSIATVVEHLGAGELQLGRVIICNGMLHDAATRPEKALEQLDSETLLKVLSVNAVVPALWLRALAGLLSRSSQCKIAVLSARVGSIEDNGLGGWYSYRASKAALNMLVKTAGIELARRAPGVKLIAFHPGTTDSPLSAPFQKRVPAEKLFEPAFVAGRLLALLDDSVADGEASFIDWQGKRVAW